MRKSKLKIFIAGHEGMVGSSIKRSLETQDSNLILTSSKVDLDLTNQSQVQLFFQQNEIDQVYIAAAKVGGIQANISYPADFIYENLAIQSNLIHASHQADIDKLVFLGSSCIYPKDASIPISEDSLLTGKLEQTNEAYAISKIAGIKMCQSYNAQFSRDYRCVMPTNLYGPHDNFHPQNSHVIPGLIYRFYQAVKNQDPVVTIWGSGEARREFLYVDDLARACIFIMNLDKKKYLKSSNNLSHINVGYGEDISIFELADIVSKVTGYTGEVSFDDSKPDGVYRKLIDSSLINSLGWSKSIDITTGIKDTFEWFIENFENIRK